MEEEEKEEMEEEKEKEEEEEEEDSGQQLFSVFIVSAYLEVCTGVSYYTSAEEGLPQLTTEGRVSYTFSLSVYHHMHVSLLLPLCNHRLFWSTLKVYFM